ncbi:hypothetical protein RXV94_03495 [Yeosuana sp. MJ-SS3]|uniref:Uncharacterized protein n=1 Tax=Gilvirhabdus luticola TaxID=3079858 RepID=A0ABU3U518_9FLAO|nr:hypothetical protein [Yeosuana sp. MJ-SS3]MDU8885210.1 hypothetical protein [Yeosuana sp. MJ-SS3]
MEQALEQKFIIRNKLFNIYEQLFFIVNILKQNEEKQYTNNSLELESNSLAVLNNLFKELWKLSDENNYFWHNCSLKVYSNYFLENKSFLIKQYGIRRFNRLLEIHLNSFTKIKKDYNPNANLPLSKNLMQDFFILLDYTNFLNEENTAIIDNFNKSKIEFITTELVNEKYYIKESYGFYKIKRYSSRPFKGDVIGHNIDDDSFVIQNMNVIHIDNKSFSNQAVNSILKVIGETLERGKTFQEFPEQNLNKKGLPKFNIQTRYELFKKIGGEKIIDNIICHNEKGKGLILGSIMDISPDNARHLVSKTYKHAFTNQNENLLKDFFTKSNIKIKS